MKIYTAKTVFDQKLVLKRLFNDIPAHRSLLNVSFMIIACEPGGLANFDFTQYKIGDVIPGYLLSKETIKEQ